MAAKKLSDAYHERLTLYEKLVATNPGIKRKGDSMPYTSHNGHMFSLLDKKGILNLRLPEKERQSFLEKYKTKLSEQYGVVMKEYVVVPDELLRDTKVLKKYFDASYEYLTTLKPKPTTKKSKTR